MSDRNNCRYLNDIKGCEVSAVYECGDFIEIAYLKNGERRTLTIEFCYYGGSMGYGAFFKYGGVELPSQYIKQDRLYTKVCSEKLSDMKHIVEIKSYFYDSYGYGDAKQLQIVYKDRDENQHSYRLSAVFTEDEENMMERIEKDKAQTFEEEVCDENIQMPLKLFSMKDYKDTLAFALKAHGEQRTPSNLPYSFHIVSVATEIINAIAVERIGYDEANVAIACALLHDVLEDTDTAITTNSLDIPNMQRVLEGVEALTKDTTLPTKQAQMQESLKKLQEQPRCVQMVKLADRITNLAPPPLWWNSAKRKSYKEEAIQILQALKGAHGYLENKLQQKIDDYERYILGKTLLNGEYKPYDYLVFPIKVEGKLKLRYLVLDKNHPNYTQSFKALNRLYEYLLKAYRLELFYKHPDDLVVYSNMIQREVKKIEKKVGISYIVQQLNAKDLLDLNKQIDPEIERYMSALYESEGCIV